MRRMLIFQFGLLVLLTDSLRAQSSQPATAQMHRHHRVTDRQIDKIRQAETQQQDQPVLTPTFSMPGSSRGKAIDSSDVLHDFLGNMSNRDRQAYFGTSKAELDGKELDNVLEQAKEFVYHELEVTETDGEGPLIDVDGDGVLDYVDVIRYSGPEFQNNRLCGPTIVFERNQKLIVRLKNMLKEGRQPVLDWIPGNEPPSPPDPPSYWMMDAPHDLFSTNIHTHGLHVSPGGSHDNSFLEATPSPDGTPREMFLDYQLPPNHIAGTFWYHGHKHGSVAYQLANGMAGALIVLGDDDPNSQDLESIEEIRAANRIDDPEDPSRNSDFGRVLLLQQLVFTKTTVTTVGQDGVEHARWIVDPADVNDRKTAPNEKNVGRITEGIPANKPESAEVLAVNGRNAPSIDIQRGQIERWRLIHAGRESELNLAWFKASDLKAGEASSPDITDAIEMYEIATDGIPTGRLTKLKNNELYPGYRSDVLVRVSDSAEDGEYWLLPSEAKRLTRTQLGPVSNSTPAVKLMVKGGLPQPMKLPPVTKLARLRRPPPDVSNADLVDVRFTFADKLRFGVASVGFGTGKPYAESGSVESISITLDKPQVWNLGVREFLPGVSEAVVHPFHMHVNPFYVPSLGVWKDTIAISREAITKIHFVPTDFSGRSVLHCHILDHEDQGMMKDINIVGPSRDNYPDLYQLERVTAEEHLQIEGLDLEPNRPNVVVFVTGMGCPYCVENVIKLWKRSDPLKDLGATIKCLSASPIEPSALASFGLSVKDHFTFQEIPAGFELNDFAALPQLIPTNAAVKSRASATHGVLIFDKQQNLRFRYLGQHPLKDLDEINYALMELREPMTASGARIRQTSRKK